MKTALQPTDLMVDLLKNPEIGKISSRRPTFSWVVNDIKQNIYQQAYQILVAGTADLLTENSWDLWDSGEPDLKSAWETNCQSLHILYEGTELEPNKTYWWKVRTWNNIDEVSPWSEPCCFHTTNFSEVYKTDCANLMLTEIKPEIVVQSSLNTWFIDFGKAAFGTVRITIDSPDSRSIKVNIGEVPNGLYGINRDPGGSRRYQEILVDIKPGLQIVQLVIPVNTRNTQEFAIPMPENLFEVYPFRYCEIIGYPGTLTRDKIQQISVNYPFNEDAARFTSSSKILNDVWDFCHYTIKATSFCGYYVDGDRERIPYEADVYINQLGHYCCDKEYAMARRTHEYLITKPTWPTEWILDSVLIGWNDFLYSGNDTSIKYFYKDLKAKSLTSLARKDGLITTDNVDDYVLEAIHYAGRSEEHFNRGIENIVDWPPKERDGFEMLPVNSVVNAFHYRAVNLMEHIACALEQTEDVQFYHEQSMLIRKSFTEKLIDKTTGLVLDGLGSTHCSLHGNMSAMASGLIPESNRKSVINFLKSKGMACSVYGSQFLLEALYKAGEADFALSLLTSTSERSWAHMIYDVGTTIALEAWDNRLKPNQDWNHAWGATPANIIPRHLMGVRPASPGFEHIKIQPQPGTLEWAEMTTPTIRGPVTVRFNNASSHSFHLETETPANTTSSVTIPFVGSKSPKVVVDGRPIIGRIDNNGITINNIGSGKHIFDRTT